MAEFPNGEKKKKKKKRSISSTINWPSCHSLSQLKQLHAHILRSTLHPCTLPLFNLAIRSLSKSASPSHHHLSLRLYLLMTRLSLSPNHFTFPFLLNSSASLSLLPSGSELHSRITKSGFSLSLPVANSLVHMYAKCGSLPLARQAFDQIPRKDVVSYNSLLSAHARLGLDMPAASLLFASIPRPLRNVISWNAMLVGYVNAGDLLSARAVFDDMPSRNFVSWSVMIMGYCKNCLLDSARELFDVMPIRNLVSWSVMISGYSQSGRPHESLALFREMERTGTIPDAAAMVGVISAASQLGRTEVANWIGSFVDRMGIERNERVLTALVDMHAKCGNVERALSLFDEIPSRDAFSYTALINGLASHGHGMKALEIFRRMRGEGIEPDHVTFVGVLSACSHAGLVEEGMVFWDSMLRDYGLEHGPDHYACMVDILGRAGRVEEAYEMIRRMPTGPHAGALGALLAACRTYGNVEIAESVARELFELEPGNTGNYILLSSIYAARERWEDAARVRLMMKGRGARKLPGSSWIEGDSQKAKIANQWRLV